ncbi:hypothetical protein [Rubripirellula obstinata]|uniref:hypothetical protein n=1 Tax=Rubripirellula obstinata TaxID=406547 RepID=UPI00135AA9DB|nr:hypothetical protein [Rubripirellula obstinata]
MQLKYFEFPFPMGILLLCTVTRSMVTRSTVTRGMVTRSMMFRKPTSSHPWDRCC